MPGAMAPSGAVMTVDCASWSRRPQDELGGGAPRPRYERLASARTATPKSSPRLTLMVGQMLGRTCCRTIPSDPVPDVRAAVMYCCASTRLATTRVRRATMADTETPIATVTVRSEAPVTATMSMASRSSGKAMRMSMAADIASSTQPPAKAAARPSGTPMAAPTTTAPMPTTSAMRAPTMTCAKRSRPSRSVPSRWLMLGLSRRPPLVSLGS